MMYARGKMGFQQKGQVMSLPPDPPLSTSSSHLFLKKYCPRDRGNYIVPEEVTQVIQIPTMKKLTFEQIDGILKVQVPSFTMHTGIVFDYK